MNATTALNSSANHVKATVPRVASIDIFRGLTMAVMIFVNQLSSVPGLPWWTYHAHADEDVMTYVDMVFPFFLFIVGMSIPISITHRLKRDPSSSRLWLHVLLRVAGLVTLGLILANAEKADASRMPIGGNLWALLGLLCATLFLNVYPASKRFPGYVMVLRGIGLAGVAVLFAIFRRSTHAGHVAWIDPSYPEILGLIGFSYLAVAVLYIPTRRWKWAPMLWFAALLALCILSTAKVIPIPDGMPIYLWPFDNGAMSSIIMAGVITSGIFLGTDRRPKVKTAIFQSISLALLMLIGGWICIPLGISKIRATPTWSMWCIGSAMLVFTLLYWICDLKGHTRWALLVKAAGSNTLLTYLLPDLWYFLFAAAGVTYLDTHLSFGWPAVIKTALFTVVMLSLATLLTKAKLRLQL
jgi:heparan-alpha-glucosaminide N-acetyltransferase